MFKSLVLPFDSGNPPGEAWEDKGLLNALSNGTVMVTLWVMHIVRTQLEGEGVLPNAYAYCLNCALLLFFCVQGGGGVKTPRNFAYVLCA